jgi:hypothetical protein
MPAANERFGASRGVARVKVCVYFQHLCPRHHVKRKRATVGLLTGQTVIVCKSSKKTSRKTCQKETFELTLPSEYWTTNNFPQKK